jgi:hypothetical protein
MTALRDNNFSGFDPRRRRTVAFASFDGGLTWSSGVDPFLPTGDAGDPWIVFDSYGNLFASAINFPDFPNGHGFIDIRASTDGGLSFPTQVAFISGTDPNNGGFLDFPKISIGPDGSGIPGNLALWFCGDDVINTVPNIIPTIGFVPVTGLGSYGTAVILNSFTEIPTGAFGIGLSEIFVNPKTGAVYWYSQNVNDYGGPSNTLGDAALISMWVNPKGTVDFNSDSFLPRRDIMIDNMNINSGFNTTTTRTLPWTPNRGVGGKGTYLAGFDNNLDRLYYVGVDMRPNLSNNNVIPIAYSENQGQTWSNQFILNEVQTVSSALPTIAVEPNTGIVAVGWYDPRRDPVKQESVDYYGVIIPPPTIPGNKSKACSDCGLKDKALEMIAKKK